MSSECQPSYVYIYQKQGLRRDFKVLNIAWVFTVITVLCLPSFARVDGWCVSFSLRKQMHEPFLIMYLTFAAVCSVTLVGLSLALFHLAVANMRTK